jgi:hypothetical protein
MDFIIDTYYRDLSGGYDHIGLCQFYFTMFQPFLATALFLLRPSFPILSQLLANTAYLVANYTVLRELLLTSYILLASSFVSLKLCLLLQMSTCTPPYNQEVYCVLCLWTSM